MSGWLEAAVLAQRLADPGMLRRGGEDTIHIYPGSRPAMPTVVLRTPPPRTTLALLAGPAVGGTVDVSDLDAVDGATLHHGVGTGDDIPRMIGALATGNTTGRRSHTSATR